MTERQQHHRGKAPVSGQNRPTTYAATGPDQFWSWGITYLCSSVKGDEIPAVHKFFEKKGLELNLDVCSKMVFPIIGCPA